MYARGSFGRPIHPIDPNVLDRLTGGLPMLDPQEGLDEPALPKIRADHGPFESDEGLLMFLFMHPAPYSNFKKNRQPITWAPRPNPVTALVKELVGRTDLASVEVERDSLKLSLSSSPGG